MNFYLNEKTNKVHTDKCINLHDNFILIDSYSINNYNCDCKCMEEYNNLLEINKYCKQYNLQYEIKFNYFYIKTEISNWKFTILGDGKIKLFHGNYLYIKKKDDYHLQFKKDISIERLIYYIYIHDKRKWNLKRE